MIKPHYQDDAATLYAGDCLDVLADLPDASVDSVVTDPPYGLDFMGKKWDTGAVAFDTAIWGHCLRVLKPGGHILAFGGTRTWHRLAAAIEDAGFEIRDSIAWLYGSGFPKSLDVSKAIDKAAGAEREVVGISARHGGGIKGNGSSYELNPDIPPITAPATDDAKRWQGWGTALKPAFEPVVVGRKPLSGTVAANVLAHGVGALNIDGCRVDGVPRTTHSAGNCRTKNNENGIYGDMVPHGPQEPPAGRWPSNVVVDEVAAQEIDRQSGVSVSTSGGKRTRTDGSTVRIAPDGGMDRGGHDDEGGASRFFPTFKYQAKAPTEERPTANGVAHPTVKPLDLMRWLIRLVTPPGGTVLEPFAGSGTTAEAAIHEHMRCIAIEREPDYLPLIVARLTKPIEIGFNFEVEA